MSKIVNIKIQTEKKEKIQKIFNSIEEIKDTLADMISEFDVQCLHCTNFTHTNPHLTRLNHFPINLNQTLSTFTKPTTRRIRSQPRPDLSLQHRSSIFHLYLNILTHKLHMVAHNGIARVVHSYFYDMTNEEYAAAGIKNCQLVEYTFE